MTSMSGLFNILALLYIFRTVQLAITLGREWSKFTGEPLTAHKKSLANQAAFFIVVPIAVFVHELAHVLAVLAAGGRVAEFHYRVFWGYVVPQGSFTGQELWWIAIAGTLGSILVGILFWLGLRSATSSSIRYFALRALRFQIYFSLIYYPLFTLLGFDGDWRVIYDFASTPLLSAATAVAHAANLFAFWRFDRQGWFEAPAFASEESQHRFARLTAEAGADPNTSPCACKSSIPCAWVGLNAKRTIFCGKCSVKVPNRLRRISRWPLCRARAETRCRAAQREQRRPLWILV